MSVENGVTRIAGRIVTIAKQRARNKEKESQIRADRNIAPEVGIASLSSLQQYDRQLSEESEWLQDLIKEFK